mmetsp:Transcript_13216/g.28505  ORF Transcript_13216/g.28505 Transcript_13216/m.28505 type:complete len:174 (-) Transcript_13216:89-610(-)
MSALLLGRCVRAVNCGSRPLLQRSRLPQAGMTVSWVRGLAVEPFDPNEPCPYEPREKLVIGTDEDPLPPGHKGYLTDKEAWENQNLLYPRQSHFWYDDGYAQPEEYIDRNYYYKDSTALAQNLSMFAFIYVFFGGLATLMGDRFRPVVDYEETLPFDLNPARGLPPRVQPDEE